MKNIHLNIAVVLLLSLASGCGVNADYKEGREYFDQREYAKAYASYQKALENDPENPDLLTDMGIVCIDLHQGEKSVEYYTKALDYVSDDKEAYVHALRAQAYNTIGNFEASLRDCEIAIAINPEETLAYISKGIAYDKMGNNGFAVINFDIAIGLDSNHLSAYAQKGLVHYHLKEYKEAIAIYDYVLKRNPNYPLVNHWKGLALTNINQPEEALKCFDLALRDNKAQTESMVMKGLVYIDMNNKEMGCNCFQKALLMADIEEHKKVIEEYIQEFCQ